MTYEVGEKREGRGSLSKRSRCQSMVLPLTLYLHYTFSPSTPVEPSGFRVLIFVMNYSHFK